MTELEKETLRALRAQGNVLCALAPAGEIQDFCENFRALLDLERDELVGRPLPLLISDSEQRVSVQSLFDSGRLQWRGRLVLHGKPGRRAPSLEAKILRTEEPSRGWILTGFPVSRHTQTTILEYLPHLYWTCSAEGPCTYLSPQWVEYTGTPAADQLGFGWLESLHPEDRELTVAAWRRTAQRREGFDSQFRIRRHDGEYRWFKTCADPVKDAEGRVLMWVGTNTDIQELKDTQARLGELNAKLEDRIGQRTRELEQAIRDLQAAQSITRTGSWTLDVATGEVEWSEQLYHIVGLDPERSPPNYELQEAMFTPDSWQRLTRAIDRSLRTGDGYELELNVIRLDGQVITAVARAETRCDDEGGVTQLLGTLQDITELAETRKELARASERMALATAGARMGIFDWDVAQNDLRWDHTMYNLYGVSPERFGGAYEAWRACVLEEDLEQTEALLQAALRGDQEFHTTFRIREAGRIRYIKALATVFRDPQGEARRMLGINYDVTAQREAEIALEASNRDLEQFASAASHDLQEPLRAIASCTELLSLRLGDRVDDEIRQLMTLIVSGASRMRDQIRGLLHYARVDSTQERCQNFPSEGALGQALSGLRTAISESGAKLSVGDLPEIFATRPQVVQLFQNLVSNALKYRGKEPPRIEITARSEGDFVEFRVADNGIGIAGQYRERIFEIFQRLHTQQEYPGTGIGLALCQRIVDRHGGRIWVESQVDQGSDFRFTLPSARDTKPT